MKSHQQLIQLEASLLLAGEHGRQLVQTSSFVAFISASDNPYMSFATPTNDAPDWSVAIRTLCDVFTTRNRRARLEYFHELHPSLAPALEAAGFQQSSAAPVMTLTQNMLAPRPTHPHGTYRRLQADQPERLKEFLISQSVAYGGTGGNALAWFPQLADGLRGGTILAAGLEQDSDFVSGVSIQVGGNIGELAGVWTRPDRQRRGLAFSVCRSLLADYFAAGFELCWLSAAEGAEGVYKRLGFVRVGTQLNYDLPGEH